MLAFKAEAAGGGGASPLPSPAPSGGSAADFDPPAPAATAADAAEADGEGDEGRAVRWALSLEMHTLVAAALLPRTPADAPEDYDAMGYIRTLSQDEVAERLDEAGLSGLMPTVWAAISGDGVPLLGALAEVM